MVQGLRATILLLVIILGTAVSPGCLSSVFGSPEVYIPPVVVTPVPEQVTRVVTVGDMALGPGDLPADYSLKDRSVIAYDETGQLAHDLGWIHGYRVVYYRLNHDNDDITGIRQVIGMYPAASINRVYEIEKELLFEESGMKKYEIPFPRIGEKSIAVRIIEPGDPRNLVVYSVVFIKNNIFEQITMGGTATDYETLKSIAITAADKIP
ncbi:hypothetical protein [Methanoregula sp.]|uniref:hypothetical protein n=1 Tax=Methanoregula sp. TaxID=2052170 RepID=UPI003561D42A